MTDQFSFATFLVKLKAVTPVVLPEVSGSTFRGAFGNAFKRVQCRRYGAVCQECYLRGECLYFRYFERTVQGDRQPVRPYIFETPIGRREPFQPGEAVHFGITLVGESLEHLLEFLAVFEAMGKEGIGKGRPADYGRCELEAVYAVNNSGYCEVYPRDGSPVSLNDSWVQRWSEFQESDLRVEKIKVHFLTHARFQESKRYVREGPPFHVLVARLLERIKDLDKEYCGGLLDFPMEDLKAFARGQVKTIEEETEWRDWERYSSRRDGRDKFGGLLGSIVYEGDVSPFIPYLRIGEYIHVGKQATFGNGLIKVEVLQD